MYEPQGSFSAVLVQPVLVKSDDSSVSLPVFDLLRYRETPDRLLKLPEYPDARHYRLRQLPAAPPEWIPMALQFQIYPDLIRSPPGTLRFPTTGIHRRYHVARRYWLSHGHQSQEP